MRSPTILAAVLFASFLQCTTSAVGPPPAPPVDWHAFAVPRFPDAGASGPTSDERAVAEMYAGAMTQPDFAPLGASFDAGVHFAFPGASDARGREGVIRAHETLFGAFVSRAIAVSRIWRTDSAQVLEWSMTGLHAREWMGVAPTHKTVAFKGLTLLWTKDDGSITDVHVYFDVATVKAQLGAGGMSSAGSGRDARAGEPADFIPPSMLRGAPEVFEQTSSPEEKGNVAPARAAIGALEKHDLAAYLATMTDDVEVFTLERRKPMHGKEDMTAYFKTMHRAIGQLDTTLDNAWGIGPFAIVEYDIAGEQIGALGWIPANRDKVVRLHVVDVVELRDGKIARMWRYDNPGEISAAP